MMIGFRSVFFSIAITMLAVPVSAQQQDADDEPSDPDTGKATIEERTLGLPPNPLAKNGLKFSATYIGEGLGNPVGGFKQGGVYEGRLNLSIDVDFEKARLWEGGSFHVNAFEIHGRGLTRENVGNLITLSGVEALATTRLYELWYEQKWSDDRYSMRIGQLAADTEFLTSKYTDVFINSTFTWPTITNVNLPAGGPSPPLAAVGVLGRAKLSEDFTVLGAVFDGNSAGPGFDDPQVRNRYGTNFRVNDPPFSIAEAQYSYKAPRLKTAGVDRAFRRQAEASDHAPVWIELSSPRRGKVR